MKAPYVEIVVNQAFLEDLYLLGEDETHTCDAEELRDDFVKFLKKLDRESTVFLTDFETEQALYQAIAENPFMEELNTYGPPDMRTGQFEAAFDGQSQLLRSGSPFKLFLLDGYEEATMTSLAHFGYFATSSAKIVHRWRPFSQERSDTTITISQHHFLREAGAAFTDWTGLKAFLHPVHSVLLFDPYIFDEKAPVAKNLKPLLLELLGQAAQTADHPVQILIISKENLDPGKAKDLEQDLCKYLKKHLGLDKVLVQIVIYDDKIYRSVNHGERHIDRWILTNNFYIKAPHGFNVFDQTSEIKRATDIEFKFVLHNRHVRHPFFLLQSVQRFVKRVNPDVTFRLFRGLES